MTGLGNTLRQLLRHTGGTALIETAIVAPVLIVMSIGTFETSRMVARQSELQSSAEQATEIALAIIPDTETELGQVKSKLMASSKLSEARVVLNFKYRCAAGALETVKPSCSEDSLATYISMELSDEYQPVWTNWGFGKSFEYHLRRTVQIS